ncbi:MAG: ABC transporter ATP-binding protein [Pseudomonadota bacterium]
MSTLLDIQNLSSGYGLGDVLQDVSLHVETGEVVSVVGANGAGKTTLLRTVSGLLTPTGGRVVFDGQTVSGVPAHKLIKRGMSLVPEGGRLFPFMSVAENLELGGFTAASRQDNRRLVDEMMTLFPVLGERRNQMAGSLSGGERQMCAVARALMSSPRLLMLDEPSAGLSPLMLEKVLHMLKSVVAARQVSVLLVEQHVEDALEMSNRGYVIESGRIVQSGTGAALMADPDIQRAYMGL